MKITDDILRIEKEYNLFDIENKQGLKVWEAIRYSVNTQILRHVRPNSENKNSNYKSSFLFSLKRLCKFLSYAISHRRCSTLFIIYSRTINENQFCDIISDGLFKISDKKNTYVIETSFNWAKKNYKYGTVSPSLTTLIMRLQKSKYDFSQILSIMSKEFPNVEFDINEIQYYYNLFLAQYNFYRIFFKLFHFKRVFFVQNGICKGLIAAAKANHVKIFELQHGQISRNHFAYSYPQQVDDDNLYNPDCLLTFGPLWLKDSVFPGVRILPIGNDSYCYKGNNSKVKKKNVLVVSSIIHQEELKQLVKDISSIDSSFHFIYKLHPDEYRAYNSYVDYFSHYTNVEVVKNEHTISDIIPEIEFTLVVQSTVMVETLNAGKRVFVYRILDYEVMDFLYNEEGISFIDDAKSFVEQYSNMEDGLLPQGHYFMPFNKEVGYNILNC